MKPKFLDNPPRHTRTQREGYSPVRYASPIEGPARSRGYGAAWWVCMAILTAATAAVLVL